MVAYQKTNDFVFRNTTATQKIFALRKRIRAVTGGTAASKTISILVWLIDYCQSHKGKVATVVSESVPHLKVATVRDFKKIMQDRQYWVDDRWNETDRIYKFETGSILEFSPSTFEKAHGPRRNVLFINECNNIAKDIADQLITRTDEIVWLDWNPTTEFWFYTDMLGKREDIDFITLTYLDNEAISPVTLAEILSRKDNYAWFRVYGLGLLGRLESAIYRDWQIIDTIPHEAKLVRYGLDFGYTHDPTVIVAIYEYNGGYIIDQILYQKGMSNKAIADVLNLQPKAPVIADSSEPKSIDEIALYGISIFGATKGPGSVLQGIQFVQAQRISLTSRSVQTIKAERNYVFMTDRNGVITNEPDDTVHEWSNSMDAIRYGLDGYRRKKIVRPQTNFGGVLPLIPGTFT